MKICSIGNSFSQDAHKWLYKLAKDNGYKLETVNLYIGGCDLKTHFINAENNNPYYSFEPNGNKGTKFVSINEVLTAEKWDVITLQQVSQHSGMPETFRPYLTSLANTVKKLQPEAKLYFHQTWAYETDSDHYGFANYNNSQEEMYNCILKASEQASELIGAELIPTGTVIQRMRENLPEFDYKNGGLSLCRDGFHLSLDYGRYAAAATWLRVLTGIKIGTTDFEDFNSEYLNKINGIVNSL
ncbi:MAG: DUF4886 domain-containing protein [Ruminococcaceae bacterium]|nr:DUF4886 domain-containing protein [Oscillospiraceae bacterium]